MTGLMLTRPAGGMPAPGRISPPQSAEWTEEGL